jgi:hypothetical protein
MVLQSRSFRLLALLALGIVAASPPATDPAREIPKSPGLVQPPPARNNGWLPGRRLPGRGDAQAPKRRATASTPVRQVAVTVRVMQGSPQPPRQFQLAQCFPNPFSRSTSIRFGMPVAARATLAIYDVTGQRVATLVDTDLGAGEYVVHWDGTGNASRLLTPGVYFYRLNAGRYESTRKIVYTRP